MNDKFGARLSVVLSLVVRNATQVFKEADRASRACSQSRRPDQGKIVAAKKKEADRAQNKGRYLQKAKVRCGELNPETKQIKKEPVHTD